MHDNPISWVYVETPHSHFLIIAGFKLKLQFFQRQIFVIKKNALGIPDNNNLLGFRDHSYIQNLMPLCLGGMEEIRKAKIYQKKG